MIDAASWRENPYDASSKNLIVQGISVAELVVLLFPVTIPASKLRNRQTIEPGSSFCDSSDEWQAHSNTQELFKEAFLIKSGVIAK